MPSRTSQLFRLTALSAALITATGASATTYVQTELSKKLASAQATDKLTVVVTFKQSGPVTPAQVSALQALGVQRGISMRSLPIVGVAATPAVIKKIAARSDVHSVFLNSPVKLLNNEANQQSGSRLVNERYTDFPGRGIPFSGHGVTVVVNDSGIDTTNPDLPLGTKVVDNVQAAQNIALSLASDFAPAGILPIVHVRNQINTDLGSGHGTHVAGTVGGTGQQSRGKQRGAAPGAQLLGYGSGGVLLILDAVGGLDYALTNQFSYNFPIRVTSNSWGTSGPVECGNPVHTATYELNKKGILSVFAAGNDGPGEDTHNPYAQAPWVVSVGASEKDGVLTDFSSRGKRGGKTDCTMNDGTSHTFVNEPTIVAAGVDIVSTRALTGALPLLGAEQDSTLPANEVPYYTYSSGTSMATPHVSGVVALMLEANPNLKPSEIRSILQQTATNMTARDRFEVGAGHLNAYAAVALAQARATGGDIAYGVPVKTARTYFSNQVLQPAAPTTYNVTFSPVGTNAGQTFSVGADVVEVTARMSSFANPVGVQLISPSGKVYGSSIALPVLGENVAASGPGEAGTWTVKVKGLGSLSGVALDPLRLTNGYGLPESFPIEVSQLKSGGFTGLNDIGSHPAKNAIQYAVGKRLVDGYSNGVYLPDAALTRSELAQYLVFAGSLRQSLPFGTKTSTSGLSPKTYAGLYPYAEIVTAKGSVLRDLTHSQAALMPLQSGGFNPSGRVSQFDLGYALVQSLALQPTAAGFTGEVTFLHEGKTLPVEIIRAAGQPALTQLQKGYVQIALNTGLLRPELFLKPATTFGGLPTLAARFNVDKVVTRAEYALAAGQFQTLYQAAED